MNPIPSHGRIPSLDGWRAIAILLVLGCHTIYTSGFPYQQFGWIDHLFQGELGVRIFFVLSGFLISLLLIREADQHDRVSLRDFYIRRVFRIFPCYFAYLGVLGILTLAGFYSDTVSSWLGCLTFTRNMVGVGQSGTIHFWSLAVEEQFYLCWPLLFSSLRLWKKPRLYFLLLLIPIIACPVIRASFISHNHGATLMGRILGERSIFAFADSLAVGCLGAWLAARTSKGGSWRYQYHILIVLAFLVVMGGTYLRIYANPHLDVALDALIPSVQAWAILLLFWLTASPRAIGYGFLNSTPMSTLGILSYSIYIWHFMFLSHFMGQAVYNWPTHDWKVWFLPALLVAAVSYYCLEKPVLRLRSKFRHQI